MGGENLSYYVEPDMKNNGVGYQVFYQEAYPCTVSAKAHIHNSVEFIYVDKGSFNINLGEAEFFLTGGDILVARSGEIHRICAGGEPGNGYYVVKISPSLMFGFADEKNAARYILEMRLGEGKKSVWRHGEPETAKLTDLVSEIFSEFKGADFGSDIAVRSGCARLLLEMMRITSPSEADRSCEASDSVIHSIYKATEYINNHYKEQISALECSRHVGLSYSYFSRSFKSVMGKSFSDYLCEVRINHAKKRLLTTSKPISEIAYECGFGDSCYFTAAFRKKCGITPRQFRTET